MDNEKIKALSREYAEDVFRDFRERNINHLTDEEWELSIDEVAKDTMDAFQWLSKTHCIVKKELLKGKYKKAKELYKRWHGEYERGATDMMESLFSKDDLIGKEVNNGM